MDRLAIIVEYQIKPEFRVEFEQRLKLEAAATLRDDGCLRMEILTPQGEPHRLLLSELWRDRAALDAHGNAPGHSHAWCEYMLESRRATVCTTT